jgi:predicted DNA binding CopG/RHH family protein
MGLCIVGLYCPRQLFQKQHFEATFLKNKRINIRISQRDLEYIQRRALEEGLPYQTLISSLIHRYISIKLVKKDKIFINQ